MKTQKIEKIEGKITKNVRWQREILVRPKLEKKIITITNEKMGLES